MLIDDPALPAAPHLVGPAGADALVPAVGAFGGRLVDSIPSEVHYRPGRDLVVRYDAKVAWGDGEERNETLLASTTRHGVWEGVVPVEAVDLASGEALEVGVWRWPFDPALPGLAQAVTPALVGELVDGVIAGPPFDLTVRAYRPTERAVVEVTDRHGTRCFLKLVRRDEVEPIVARHRALRAAGVPAPEVLVADPERGLVVLEAIDGPTLREQLDRDGGSLPGPTAFADLATALAHCAVPSASPVRSRASAALGHARLLRLVAPELAVRIDAVTAPLHDLAARSAARAGSVIHGDLYDAQLVVDGGGAIVGVLDVDDAGPGDPLDDHATVLAFLAVKAMFSDRHDLRARLERYAAELRAGFVRSGSDDAELDMTTAAVLIGLATGPFRAQHPDWRTDVERHLARAEALMTSATSLAPI